MAAALSSVGYFLYLDASYTPVAVVTGVVSPYSAPLILPVLM
jgi:hypothetical protein